MLTALLNFLVLFALVKIFEKGRDDLDNFNIAVAAIVPVLLIFVSNFVVGLYFPGTAAEWAVPSVLLIAGTFLILWKNLEISASRSGLYTAAVAIANVGFALLFAP